MNRGRVGEKRGSKEMDGCPLTASRGGRLAKMAGGGASSSRGDSMERDSNTEGRSRIEGVPGSREGGTGSGSSGNRSQRGFRASNSPSRHLLA
jgi:hypothetical protein